MKTTSRGYFGVFVVVAAMVLLCVLAGSSGATVGDTTLVSVDSSGVQADRASGSPSVSADGRYVAFASDATNLVPNDTNNTYDVFVRDRQTGTTERVSVNSSEIQATGPTLTDEHERWGPPYISADGRYVAFLSSATNLVPNDTNNRRDIFVRDRQEGTTERVSVNSSEVQANLESNSPSISADGRYVAFSSNATNLVSNDTNGYEDVFVRDRQEGTTERVSVDSSEVQTIHSFSSQPRINADGRFVAFASGSPNLVANDTNGTSDIFVRDRQEGTTERVSVNSSEVQANNLSSNADRISISAGGRFVAFSSWATNLVSNDTNSNPDIFVRDRQEGTTERVSVNSSEVQANGGTGFPSISPDGRFVAFSTDGAGNTTNLVENDTNNAFDVFMRDRQEGTTERVSLYSCGVQGNGFSVRPSISNDGRFVAFVSGADNLVAGDTNGYEDVFVRDRQPEATQTGDCIAPTTTHTQSPQPNAAGWNNSNVSVTLDATDAGGSGLEGITYSINGGAPTTVQQSSVQIPVTTERTTTISYHSTDNAGNVEQQQTFAVKIDKTKPKVSTATPTGTGVARSTSATAAFSERMDPTTITKSTFKLFKCSSTTSTNCATQITNVAITRSTDRLTATLNPFPTNPTTLLASRTKFKVVVTTGAKDEAGNPLDQTATTGNQQKVWYFTTST